MSSPPSSFTAVSTARSIESGSRRSAARGLIPPCGAREQARGLREPLLAPGNRDYLGAVGGEPLRNRAADTAAGAGDESPSTGEIERSGG